jgi:hypothetical protein
MGLIKVTTPENLDGEQDDATEKERHKYGRPATLCVSTNKRSTGTKLMKYEQLQKVPERSTPIDVAVGDWYNWVEGISVHPKGFMHQKYNG